MKKGIALFTVFVLTALILFTGCSKEEVKIEKWIIGTWELNRYVQQDFKDGVLVKESESTNQGKVKFKKKESVKI